MSWQSSDIDFCIQKVEAVRAEIQRLEASDFPHSDAKGALKSLDSLYANDLNRLATVAGSTDRALRQSVCIHSNFNILRFHPILGFILRSTNIRNSFEIFDPILRLARKLLGPDAKLVLSSEWDYSPFTYPAAFKELPKVVFIGLPVSESSHALVVPLAGHELGHSVWQNTDVSPIYS